jgi:16S rRNA (guanine527-N7)-methyltransferase
VKHPLSAAGFQALTGIDDATRNRLAVYLELLRQWQRRINLVGASTLDDPWRRHVLDCAQLAPLLPAGSPAVLDLGSGAGLPGLILAVLTPARLTLVDSDARKCAFLREAVRRIGVTAAVDNRRIETLSPAIADVVTARALAPLARLLPQAWRLLRPGGVALFLKGGKVDAELTGAEKLWTMRVVRIASVSDPAGVILKIEDLEPRRDC